MKENLPKLEDNGFTIPAQAMPDDYKYKGDDITPEHVVEAYRKYYLFDKTGLFAWKNRDIPEFVKSAHVKSI